MELLLSANETSILHGLQRNRSALRGSCNGISHFLKCLINCIRPECALNVHRKIDRGWTSRVAAVEVLLLASLTHSAMSLMVLLSLYHRCFSEIEHVAVLATRSTPRPLQSLRKTRHVILQSQLHVAPTLQHRVPTSSVGELLTPLQSL